MAGSRKPDKVGLTPVSGGEADTTPRISRDEEVLELRRRFLQTADELREADPVQFIRAAEEIEAKVREISEMLTGPNHPLADFFRTAPSSGSGERLEEGMKAYRQRIEDAEKDASWRR